MLFNLEEINDVKYNFLSLKHHKFWSNFNGLNIRYSGYIIIL